jgi:hypothetical protein
MAIKVTRVGAGGKSGTAAAKLSAAKARSIPGG